MNDPQTMKDLVESMEREGFRLAAALWIRDDGDPKGVEQRAAIDGPWIRDLEKAKGMRRGGGGIPLVLTIAEATVYAYSSPEAEPAENARARSSLLRATAARSERLGVRDHNVIWGSGR